MWHHLLHFFVGVWNNRPLMAALFAILISQCAKVFTYYFDSGRWDLHKLIEAGGMPCSHAAGVMSLCAALDYVVGPQSPIFATAVVFSAIVMYDAGGIRRRAGEHAVILNRLAAEISQYNVSFKELESANGERLKEILGHEPKEIIIGAVLGLLVGIAFAKWW